jgi:hypothetical protein
MGVSGIVTGGTIVDPSSVTVEICVQEQLTGIIAGDEDLIGIIIEDCAAAAFDISSFTSPAGPGFEVGESIVTPSFTATYNRAPDSAILTDTEGTPAKDVSVTPAAFTSDGTFSKAGNNETVTFTLSASEGGSPDAAQVVFTWRPLIFTGITANPGPYTEADIEALVTQNLAATSAFSGTVAPVNQYIVHAYPASYGALLPTNFEIGSFGPGDMTEVQTALSIANGFAVTQDYRVARSDNLIDTTITGPLAFTVTP